MRLVTWNEKDNPDLYPSQVRSDCHAMARLFGRGATVIAGQEFGDASDKDALLDAFPGWVALGEFPTPLLLDPARFVVHDSWHVQTHPGLAGVSPARGYSAVTVTVRRRFRKASRPVTVLGTHFVSGAWSPGHTRTAWRREHWDIHLRAIADAIALEHSHGRDVFLLGDMNRIHFNPAALAADAYTLASHGLDHIVYAPALGNRVRGVTRRVVREQLHTDHLPVAVSLTLTRKETHS